MVSPVPMASLFPCFPWPLLEVNDVSAHLVQEGAEVTGANDGSREGFQPILQPLDVVHVQVTRGLIQHQDVGVHQLGSTLGTSREALGGKEHMFLWIG